MALDRRKETHRQRARKWGVQAMALVSGLVAKPVGPCLAVGTAPHPWVAHKLTARGSALGPIVAEHADLEPHTSSHPLHPLTKENSSPAQKRSAMADGAPKPEAQPGTEVTAFVQGLLQQMQARFDKLSDNIIVKIDDMGSRCACVLPNGLHGDHGASLFTCSYPTPCCSDQCMCMQLQQVQERPCTHGPVLACVQD